MNPRNRESTRRILRLGAGLLLGASIVSGCAVPPRVPMADRSSNWELHKAKLIGLKQWVLRGRLAVQMDREGWTATLHWEQRQNEYLLRVSAPLGRGTFELTGTDQGVTLHTSDNRVLYAQDPESLLRENLGWQLPVAGLLYWIRGLPEPAHRPDTMLLDEKGRLNDLRQDGWQVSYLRYQTTGGYDLPGKMVIENDRLKVRLVISDWILSS